MATKERSAERLTALFALGVLLFSPLALRIFDVGADASIAGVPALVLYVFVAWACLIALIATIARTLDEPDSPSPLEPERPELVPRRDADL